MQRNTITTLGMLRTGDRFSFPGKTDVWQVVAHVTKQKTAINQFLKHQDKPDHIWDVWKPAITKVRFLRHTVKEQGEECQMDDLLVGDVFTTTQNIVFEYQLESRDFITRTGITYALDGTGQQFEFSGDHKVIFIRKGTEVAK